MSLLNLIDGTGESEVDVEFFDDLVEYLLNKRALVTFVQLIAGVIDDARKLRP